MEKQSKLPDFSIENELATNGYCRVAGIDEAGRGPWAGPVVCAAVVIPDRIVLKGLDDSKKMSEGQRNKLFEIILDNAYVGIAEASAREIDRMNIRAATLWSMSEAAKSIGLQPDFAIVDGRDVPPDLPCAGRAIIKGDGKSISIAAASVVAKVTRDRKMIELAKEYPQYGFEKHKGYGTAQHNQAIADHGVTEHHRRSYKPIREFLESESV